MNGHLLRSLRWVLVLALSIGVLTAAGCRGQQAEKTVDQAVASGNDPVEQGAPVIVVLGDSLTQGLGLLANQAYPQVLQEMLAAGGYDEVIVRNAGVSGDTSAGGLRRVEGLLEPDVIVLVVALGGNDALRGLSPKQTYENIAGIVEVADANGVTVVLAGMEAPTNLGDDYRDAFRAAFLQVARDYHDIVIWVPFLLEGVAGNPELNQADGIHPNEKGARMIAELLYPKLRTLMDQMVATATH